MAKTVVIDAGHGGTDFGAAYRGRYEKEDTLNLALAVGKILENNCIKVNYTRKTDIYNTPFEKATIGNASNSDYFISIHRNAYITPNTSSGIETLVYDKRGVKNEMANNVNNELEKLGFTNRGVIERPNLVVLKRTKIPAILIEVGFIDNDNDNKLFDDKFDLIAQAIASGIIKTIGGCNNENGILYRVQVGAFRDRENADDLLNELKSQGFPAFIIINNGIYKVQSGAFKNLDNAVKMEEKLNRLNYNTFITTN